ncbi:MAG: pantoate--beta-alanine ligase [Nitrospirae bacterium]|nr:MAG: pantoate--beta-alanine ligase [Nitrospirota bacterium]
MQVIRTIRGLRVWRNHLTSGRHPLGFVPTMGALHEGHRTLIQRARRRCRTVVVSVFVNPLQFGPREDFAEYPRTLRADLTMCRQEGVELVFAPSIQEFYPSDFQTTVSVNRLTRRWEGAIRPTHFAGVTTVLTKLFNLVKPDFAFFGQKDYQQAVVIKQLVKDLHLGVTVIVCPTAREPDGLAYSSRNQYLSSVQRRHATVLPKALAIGANALKEGRRSLRAVSRLMADMLQAEPGVTVEYVAICDAHTLEPLRRPQRDMVLLGAIRLGRTRLIDNRLVKAARWPR